MHTLDNGQVVYDSYEEVSRLCPINQPVTRIESRPIFDPSDPTKLPIIKKYRVTESYWGYVFTGAYWIAGTKIEETEIKETDND